MGGRAVAVDLSETERKELTSLSARRNTTQALALRAGIVLACAEASRTSVWRRRFAEHRIDGLRDEPRSGTPRTIGDEGIEATIVRTLESLPPGAAH